MREVVAYMTVSGPRRLRTLSEDGDETVPLDELVKLAADLTARNGGVAPPVVIRTTPWRPGRRVVVATTWNGSRVLRRIGLDEPDPTPAALSAAGRANVRGGVPAVVRVVEAAPTLRSYGVGSSGGAAGLLP